MFRELVVAVGMAGTNRTQGPVALPKVATSFVNVPADDSRTY
jgi:hypothetical protein